MSEMYRHTAPASIDSFFAFDPGIPIAGNALGNAQQE